MKERPILFSAPMVRALLEGRKTQTRRAIKPAPILAPDINEKLVNAAWQTGHVSVKCPYGAVGDRLWVRETYRRWVPNDQSVWRVKYRADDSIANTNCEWGGDSWSDRHSPADAGCDIEPARWTPTIHMPRWASRITLEVTDVRVERLQEITQADCVAEGMSQQTGAFMHHVIADYRRLWGEINGAGSWDANPWVWVIEFRRASP